MPSISSQLPHINITWKILFLINKFIFSFVYFLLLCYKNEKAIAIFVRLTFGMSDSYKFP